LQFPYVDAVLKEALRMEPPAGFGTMRQLREVSASQPSLCVREHVSCVPPGSKDLDAWVSGVL